MRLFDAIEQQEKRSPLLDYIQALSNSAASTVSGPVDLIAMGLRAAGVPVPQDAVLSSEWMARRGLTKEVPQGAARVLGETTGLVAPVAIAAKAPQVAAALNQAGIHLATPSSLSRGMIGRQRGAVPFGGVSPVHKDELVAALEAEVRRVGAKNVGLRVLPEDQAGLSVGSIAPKSFVWRDGVWTNRQLPGASAIGLGSGSRAEIEAAVKRLGLFGGWPYYDGPKVALLRGSGSAKGADAGERVIRDAVIEWIADNPRRSL